MNVRRIVFLLPALSIVSILLSGCQELRGPAWSPDGRRLAFTSYLRNAQGLFDTNVYLLESDDDTAEPQLLAKAAAFPSWSSDGLFLYYAGERDSQGYYTKIFRYKLGTAITTVQPLLTNLRLTNFQLSLDGSTALLCAGKDARPGSPCTIELWYPADNKRVDLRQLGDVEGPALSSNGKAIAFAQKVGNALPLLAIFDLDTNQPKAFFPTEDQNEANATTYIVHAMPDNDRFLFYAPGGSNVWTIRRDGTNLRKFPLPDNLSSPLMVSIAEDSSNATLTLAQAAVEKVLYHAYKLEFKTSKLTRIEGDSTELLGGHVLDPRAARRKGAIRYAWMSAGGVAIGEPNQSARYYPQSANQCIAAANAELKLKDTKRALQHAKKAHEYEQLPDDLYEMERTDARAYLAEKVLDRAADAFERSELFYPVSTAGLRFLFSPNSGLPRPLPAETAAVLKEMDELIKALPNNELIPLLRTAYAARLQGNYKEALDAYKKAMPLCADDAHSGGVRFLEGMACFENGDMVRAGEKWDSAARATDFPHASYSAGLSAIAYMLDGRPENVQKANSVLQLPSAKNGALAQDISQITQLLRGRVYHERNQGKEVKSADDSIRSWIESDYYNIPFCSLRPRRMEDKDGKASERRIGVHAITASSLWIAGMEKPLFRIPQPVTLPVISPENTRLAIAVSGEVFPLRDTLCDVYVIDLTGTPVLGDAQAALTGHIHSRYAVQNLAWDDATNLKVTGNQIDVFGGETPFTRTLNVPLNARKIKAGP